RGHATPGESLIGIHAAVLVGALLSLFESFIQSLRPDQNNVLPNRKPRLPLPLQLNVEHKVGSIPGHDWSRLFLRLRAAAYFSAWTSFFRFPASLAFFAASSHWARTCSNDSPVRIPWRFAASVNSFHPFSQDLVLPHPTHG